METVILNCDITDTLYRSGRSTVLRGVQRGDGRAVAIKVLTDPLPAAPRSGDASSRIPDGAPLARTGRDRDRGPRAPGEQPGARRGGFRRRPLAASPTLEIDAFLAVAADRSRRWRVHESRPSTATSAPGTSCGRRVWGEVRLIDFGAASALGASARNLPSTAFQASASRTWPRSAAAD
jgi:hypothetical protein